MSHPLSTPPNNAGMVPVLLVAIALMTAAIVFILGAFVGRSLAPAGAAAPPGETIDFASAPAVEVGLPPGARVLRAHVSAGRITLDIETVQGERSVYTTPLDGFNAPVRLIYQTLE